MARKTNITGIPMLSIGTTKNDKKQTLTRYCVNHKVDDKNECKSFYFGTNVDQKDAFLLAVIYMREMDLYSDDIEIALAVYKKLEHEELV